MSLKSYKISSLAAIIALVLSLMVTGLGQSTSKSVAVNREAKLGGKVIEPGKYTLVFDKDKDGELALLKEGREVLKTSYKLNQLNKEAADNVVVFASSSDGSLQVRRIEIKGMKTALQFQ